MLTFIKEKRDRNTYIDISVIFLERKDRPKANKNSDIQEKGTR